MNSCGPRKTCSNQQRWRSKSGLNISSTGSDLIKIGILFASSIQHEKTRFIYIDPSPISYTIERNKKSFCINWFKISSIRKYVQNFCPSRNIKYKEFKYKKIVNNIYPIRYLHEQQSQLLRFPRALFQYSQYSQSVIIDNIKNSFESCQQYYIYLINIQLQSRSYHKNEDSKHLYFSYLKCCTKNFY